MNRTERFFSESQSYYNYNKKRIWFLGAVILVLLLIFSVGFLTATVKAQRYGERVKLVTSVEVQKGDSLWSIASDYISEEYDNINEYIKEIKDSNGMISDNIKAGNYIIVPYYADATNE